MARYGTIAGGAARIAGIAIAVLLASGGAKAEPTVLTVYTSVIAEDLPVYKQAFEAANPDIEIRWVRDGSGIITARVLAEGDNTPADVVWNVAATSLMQIAAAGLAEPYAPKGLENIKPSFREDRDPPRWVGMDAWIATVCFNTEEAAEHGLPRPDSWWDLADPVYRNQMAMPDPQASGTGFLHVTSWLQLFGESDGWRFMDALHRNRTRYTQSGSKACRLAAAGELAVGISFAYRGLRLKEKGAPIDLIYPAEGLGWDMDAFMIVKGTPKMAAARRFADWSVTREANQLYSRNFAVVAMPGVTSPSAALDPAVEAKLIDNDFVWAATNRARILAEWQRRYSTASE